MEKVRYGILSAAQVVPRFVAGIKESAAGEVIAIASRSIEKAQKMAEELAIPLAYGSYEELCNNLEVDVVYIATYNKGHYQAAKLALSNGKHVLLEKPFTLKSAEAKELFALATEKQLFIMEAQKAVFLPISTQVKDIIQQGSIGEVKWVQAIISYSDTSHITWFDSLNAGGGVLRGTGNYPLHLLQFLLEQSITACEAVATKEVGCADTQCNLTLRFEGQIVANIFLTVQLDMPSKMVIYGQRGRIEIPEFWKSKQATIYYQNGTTEKLQTTHGSEFTFEIDHVNECILSGQQRSPIMTEKITVETVSCVEKIYRQWSEKEGRGMQTGACDEFTTEFTTPRN